MCSINDMNNTVGTACLVGAGPGAADLISVRGLERLRQAEVLLYDRLAGEALLNEVPEACEKINVGKCVGAHAMKQEDINRLLVEKALEGKYVVRLKGGDPFVFGRGGEEVLALKTAGIAYELVPGISSCIAVPELAGIPVTHRETARSFHVITGHTADEEQCDYAQYAGLSGTLIFLMGVSNLERIVKGLLSGGMDAETPVSIIENGAIPGQRRVDGTLADITDIALRAHIHAPAIIVAGTCAALHMLHETKKPEAGVDLERQPEKENFNYISEKTASPDETLNIVKNRSVGVTGSAHMAGRLSRLLEEEGLLCESFITTKICRTETLSKEHIHWSAINWIVFTSGNAVEQFFTQLAALRIDRRLLAGVKYAVVGQGTADRLSEYGVFADFIPERSNAKELGRALARKLASGTVAVFQAENAAADIQTELFSNPQLNVHVYPIYRLSADEIQIARFWEAFSHLDYVLCTSAEGVRLLKRSLPCKNKPVFLCLGAKTEAALNDWLSGTGISVLRAPVNTAGGLIAALSDIMRIEAL